MPDSQSAALNRRGFLNAGAAATVATLGAGAAAAAAPQAKAEAKVLPQRPLGKTGVSVTLLNQGTWRAPGALDRLLRFAFANGVRYFDTARSYGSEPGLARWFQAMPEVRKQIFLASKESPREPSELAASLDDRLRQLRTDYLDLYFLHALGDHDFERERALISSREFRQAADALRKSGKTKFVGFSTHHPNRAELLNVAAKSGGIDVIMLQYTPWLEKDSELNKALDACYKAGIGLVSMKQVAGQYTGGDNRPGNPLAEVYRRAPVLKEKGLTPYQGLLHAIWTDERISSSCVSMRTVDQIRENSEAARTFEPLKLSEIQQLRDAALAHGPTLCADCDGRCSRAAGTHARLGDLTRYLTYYEHHGYRGEARKLYSTLSERERDWTDADLEAARAACPNRLDFARLLPRVREHLA